MKPPEIKHDLTTVLQTTQIGPKGRLQLEVKQRVRVTGQDRRREGGEGGGHMGTAMLNLSCCSPINVISLLEFLSFSLSEKVKHIPGVDCPQS